MHKHVLHSFALIGGFGLLAACPGGPSTTSATATETDTHTSTTDVSTTGTPTTLSPTTGTTLTTEPTGTTDATTGTDTTDTTGTTDTTTGTTGGDGPLCEALGGTAGITELVAAAMANVLADDRINGYFLNSDFDQAGHATCLEKRIGELAECAGVTYDCAEIAAAHASLGISTNDFMDFAEDFAAALDAHPGLSDDDKATVAAALQDLSPDLVTDATSDATFYQRAGRKPGIKGFVGALGEPGTFIENISVNVAINGFFDMSDFERFATCLTRQLGGIDGPIKYGKEVDAPPGIDIGVSAGNPCRPMSDAHTDVVDTKDNIGIDINDFNLFVSELATAMNNAGLSAEDQAAVIAVLDPMCEEILMPSAKNECPSARKLEIVEASDIGGSLPMVYNGTVGSMFCQDLVVPDDPINFIEDITVTVGLDHTWVGDLVIKLFSPEDKVLTIVSRPGFTEMTDGTMEECCGDSSNLSAAYPLTFKDGAALSAENLGQAGNPMPTNNQIICKDDNINPCEWSPFPGAGPGNNFSDFFGDTAAGTWRLCVGDGGPDDPGTLQSVKLEIQRVKYDPMP